MVLGAASENQLPSYYEKVNKIPKFNLFGGNLYSFVQSSTTKPEFCDNVAGF